MDQDESGVRNVHTVTSFKMARAKGGGRGYYCNKMSQNMKISLCG